MFSETVLHECLRQGPSMMQCVKALVRCSADVSCWNKQGETPVHLAIRHHWDPSIIQLFIWKGYAMDFDRRDAQDTHRSGSKCLYPTDVKEITHATSIFFFSHVEFII